MNPTQEQLTAWALNELSAEERAAVESSLKTSPESRQFAEDTRTFCREMEALLAESPAEATLSTDQREKIIAAFRETKTELSVVEGMKPHRPKSSLWLWSGAAAACLALLAGAWWSDRQEKATLAAAKSTAEADFELMTDRPAVSRELNDVEALRQVVQARSEAVELTKVKEQVAEAMPPVALHRAITLAEAQVPMNAAIVVEASATDSAATPLRTDIALHNVQVGTEPGKAANSTALGLSTAVKSDDFVEKADSLTAAASSSAGASLAPMKAATPALVAARGTIPAERAGKPIDLYLESEGRSLSTKLNWDYQPAAVYEYADAKQKEAKYVGKESDTLARYRQVSGQTVDLAKRDGAQSPSVLIPQMEGRIAQQESFLAGLKDLDLEDSVKSLQEVGVTSAALEELFPDVVKLRNDLYQNFKEGLGPNHPDQRKTGLQLAAKREELRKQLAELWQICSDKVDKNKQVLTQLKEELVTQQKANAQNERYVLPPENAFTTAKEAPLSTFSIDVDTASYANVRRFLNQGQLPPPAAVRLEEMVNYFAYDYPKPEGEKPFSVSVDLVEAPWKSTHRLARIGLKGKEFATNERPAANLVFLVDVSGSMNEPNKLPLVKQSLSLLTKNLSERDHVAIVTYAGHSGIALPATSGSNKEKILNAIESLQNGGGTHASAGIRDAYSIAKEQFKKEGINRVILATDGDFNIGVTDPGELEKLIIEKAKSGVFLSVLGYGTGNLKDVTMERLADKGNGNYAYIDTLGEARKVLGQQMNATLATIAKDVKIQIEFNPAVVRSYRLLGYENRMLAKEDFNDDTKDAGEIGAGHTVTALYEVVPVSAPEETPPVDGLKYAAATTNAEGKVTEKTEASIQAIPASRETMTVKLRWKAPDGEVSTKMEVPVTDEGKKLSDAPADARFAAGVAAFGLVLKNSAHKGTATYELARDLCLSGKGLDPEGWRGECIQLIDRAQGIAGSK